MLSDRQKALFDEQGYLLVENALGGEQLREMRQQFADWVEESRSHEEAYGETVDGRARFDLEPGHRADKPALRRVNAPTDISAVYYRVMRDSAMTDCVAELIGPNVKYHHSKINSKLPGTATEVKWHQDFPFTPHSNDDLVTALLMIDEVTDENGPLQVLPGS
ncbi:MAG: phytanoyl-CoA dioxygenase family protein, partial [Gammaproteobacteria bacterium]|nr:phytanoyl-CoA dioxygenase family protein [Gammaproteobacteria bacterium]